MIQYNVYFLDMDIPFFYSLKLFSYKADNCNTQQSFRIEHQPLCVCSIKSIDTDTMMIYHDTQNINVTRICVDTVSPSKYITI